MSSNSWLNVWIGLEINLLAFIPLIRDRNRLSTTESSLKYFLTQALASCTLLIGTLVRYYSFSLYFYSPEIAYYANIVMLSSLIIKRGAAPLHWWMPVVINGLSWVNALIIMTWQKIAPIILITYVVSEPLITVRIICSVTVGALGGLRQTSLRKLMAYSSINHLGWIFMAIKSRESLVLLYLLFYFILTFNVILIFYIFDISHLSQIFSNSIGSKRKKFFIFINLLSIGGLPPFIGFIPKWIVIERYTNVEQFFILSISIIITLVTLFFYLRICYSAFMLNSTEINLYINSYTINNFRVIYSITLTSSIGLFFIRILYFLL